jgi:hypothetical protein
MIGTEVCRLVVKACSGKDGKILMAQSEALAAAYRLAKTAVGPDDVPKPNDEDYQDVAINLGGVGTLYLNCHEENCPHTRECALHITAGEFRSEGGMTPFIRPKDGSFQCSKASDPTRSGSLVWHDGQLIGMEAYHESLGWH